MPVVGLAIADAVPLSWCYTNLSVVCVAITAVSSCVYRNRVLRVAMSTYNL